MSIPKFTLYTFNGSQWAQVAHLALAHKRIPRSSYDLCHFDLITAENFDPDYLSVNPNGTIPSLISPALPKPITESKDILRYIDTLPSDQPVLTGLSDYTVGKAERIIKLVHSPQLDTNLILLRSRDETELRNKRLTLWNDFVVNRQGALSRYVKSHPQHTFYGPKLLENTALYEVYTKDFSASHQLFFEQTEKEYVAFSQGLRKLDQILEPPYAVGKQLTEADFHITAWLAHLLWGAGTDPKQFHDFEVLEDLIRKSDHTFQIGDKLRQWWHNITETEAFKEVYPTLH